MAGVNLAKEKEGDKLMREATALTKTTLTRWKPDYDGAAPLFQQAATAYRAGRVHEKAVAALVKAAETFAQGTIYYTAGKDMEQAAMLTNTQLKKPADAAKLYQEAAMLYRQNTKTPEKAAECLSKAARLLEDIDVDQAIQLADEACALYVDEDKPHLAKDAFILAEGMLVRAGKFVEAAAMYKRQAEVYRGLQLPDQAYKCHLCAIVLFIKAGDSVAAEREFQAAVGADAMFFKSQEGQLIHSILDALEKADDKALAAAKAHTLVGFLDPPIARFIRALSLNDASAGDGLGATSTLAPEGTTTTDAAQTQGSVDDDFSLA